MNNSARVRTYGDQENMRCYGGGDKVSFFDWTIRGTRDLTPKQQRRVRKAHNRTRRRLQALAKAGLKHLDATAEERLDWGAPQAVACPRCGATGNDPCQMPSGAARNHHKGRNNA